MDWLTVEWLAKYGWIFPLGAALVVLVFVLKAGFEAQKETDECEATCRPYVSQTFSGECYCMNPEKHWVPRDMGE